VKGERQLQGSRGNNLVEFALVLPVLLMLLMGILDLGRAFYVYSAISNAAREGARRGIITPDDTAAIVTTVQEWAIGLDPDQMQITVQLVTAEPQPDRIQVTVTYSFHPVTPLVSRLLGGQGYLTLSTSTVMTVE